MIGLVSALLAAVLGHASVVRRCSFVSEPSPAHTRQRNGAMMGRRDHLLAYIDGLIAQYGEANVLALP